MDNPTPQIQPVDDGSAPAVSVVMPAYRVARYIGAALDSVLAQTFGDYEIIVVNDGSPDTVELEQALEPYRSRIVYIKQENQGPSGARNTAIRRSRGTYVALLDSDDVWLPDYLAEQMKILRDDPLADLIYADAELFGDSALAGQTFMQSAPSRGGVTFESLAGWECCVITSCVVARRQSLIDAGLFDENFIRSEDFDLWLRLAHRGGRLIYQRRVLALHRMHEASLAADSSRMFESQIEVFRKTATTLPLSLHEQKLIERQIASCKAHMALTEGKRRFACGDYEQALEYVSRANDFFRRRKLQLALLGMRIAPRLLHRLYLMRYRAATQKIAAEPDAQISV
ncbi:MAG: glycosyltransferase family 2 protein [Pyrinomonadaceae bacterium]